MIDRICLCCHAVPATDSKNTCKECEEALLGKSNPYGTKEEMKPDEAAAQYCKSIKVEKDYPFELQGTKYFDNNGNEVTFERIFTAGQEHERKWWVRKIRQMIDSPGATNNPKRDEAWAEMSARALEDK